MHPIEWYRQQSLLYAIGNAGQPTCKKWKRNNKLRKPKQRIPAKDKWWRRYETYIHSPKWEKFKASIIAQRGRKCERCGATAGRIDLHHLNYHNLGHEKPEDVMLTCYDCHRLAHPAKSAVQLLGNSHPVTVLIVGDIDSIDITIRALLDYTKAVDAVYHPDPEPKNPLHDLMEGEAYKAYADWCTTCGGKGFLRTDGSLDNAFVGSDIDPKVTCAVCKGTGLKVPSCDTKES